jgi:hypothetical protein
MEHDDADLYFESVEAVRGALKRRLRSELDERDGAAIDAAIFAAVRAGYRDGVRAVDFAVEAEVSIPQSCATCGATLPPPLHRELPVDQDQDPWADWDKRFGNASPA